MTIDLDALERIALAWDDSLVSQHADTVLALIARVRELEAVVNDGGNQAAKYWTRLTAAERERDRYRAAIEEFQEWWYSDDAPRVDYSDYLRVKGIFPRALNDKEAEK